MPGEPSSCKNVCVTPRIERDVQTLLIKLDTPMLSLFSGLLILSGSVLALVGVLSKTKSEAEKLTATLDSGFFLFYLALLLSGDPKILLSMILMASGVVLLGLAV